MAEPPVDIDKDIDNMDLEALMALPHEQFITIMLLNITTQLTKLTQILLDREKERKG